MKLRALVSSLLVGALAVLGASCEDELRDESGAIDTQGSVSAFALRPGDCLDEPNAGEFAEVSALPCDQPHNLEVFAIVEHPAERGASYPRDDSLDLVGFELCLAFFDDYVGRVYDDSRLDITTFLPTRESWTLDGDREITCLLYDLDSPHMTGSMKGSGR